MYRNKRSTISTFLAELKTDGENGSVAWWTWSRSEILKKVFFKISQKISFLIKLQASGLQLY